MAERYPTLLAELVGLKVDLIVTTTTTGALAAKRATTEIPIVFSMVSDPVASGLVASLARPGGNATGWSNILPEASGTGPWSRGAIGTSAAREGSTRGSIWAPVATDRPVPGA
jgi:hypothetical protein